LLKTVVFLVSVKQFSLFSIKSSQQKQQTVNWQSGNNAKSRSRRSRL